MIKYLAPFVLAISGVSAFSQTWMLDTRGKTAGDFIYMENKLGSTSIKYKYNYIGKSGLAQPIQFRRKESHFPDLLVTYYFYQSDSVIDKTEYDWNEVSYNDTIESKDRKSSAEIMPYLRKYQEIYSEIQALYGSGEIEGNLDTSGVETDQFHLENKATWQLTDSVKLSLSIFLSNKYSVSENAYSKTYTVPQYHIKLTAENPSRPDNGQNESQLSDKKIHALDSAYQMFLKDMKNGNLDSAKTRLSPLLINKVGNEQLTELKKSLRLEQSSVIFMTGIQTFMDGSSGSMLQYKYESDKGSPPTEMVKVIFDQSGKILGIRPAKRQ